MATVTKKDSKPTTPKNTDSGTKDAAKWKARFENRENKLRPIFEDAQKYYDIMYAVQNTTKISPWKSKVYVPVLASKAWDLIARMSDVVPYFDVSIKNELEIDDSGNFAQPEAVEQRERRIEAKLHYDYNCGHEEPMKLKVFDPLVDAVVAGTGYAYAPWVFNEQKYKGRKFDAQGNMKNKTTVTKTVTGGYNEFEGVNFFNVFPGDAASFYKAPYLIVRGYKNKVDMEASGLYENLDKCKTEVSKGDQFYFYNISRNRIVNEMDLTWDDEQTETITYYECYERTTEGVTLVTYAESEDAQGNEGPWIQIRAKSIPYWHNMFPIVPFYLRKKSYSVFGESLFENNRTLQSATNDLFNHYLDNWNLSIESMIMYEDGTLTNDFIIEPGGEITFTGEAPKQFKFPEPNPQQLSLVMNVLEKGIDAATFSPYATGQPADSNDKTRGTAYGVKTISEAATTKIGFFRDNFKQSMKILGRIWLSNLQQFADSPQEIRRIVNGKVQPDVIMPSDYQGEIDLDIDDDSMTPMTKADKRDAMDRFIQDVLALQKAGITQAEIFKQPSDVPRYNFVEMTDDLAELYSIKDFERYILDSTVQIPTDTSPQSNIKELVDLVALYKVAGPYVRAQIAMLLGFKPEPTTGTEVVTTAMEHGATQAGHVAGHVTPPSYKPQEQPQGDVNGQPSPTPDTVS